jgi:hypothetical protein
VNELLAKIRKTVRFHGRRLVVATRSAWWDIAGHALERPIFVVGCSRAGTTVVYKTLSESREIGSLQRETHDFWLGLHPLAEKNWHSHTLGAADATASDRDLVSRYFFALTGRYRVVDKNNQNGLCVPYLHALFPDAHFVYVKRSAGDNIHSLIEGWGRADEFATWSRDIPAEIRVDNGRYTRWCFFLPQDWRSYVSKPIEDVCAFQYRAMNEAILGARPLVPSPQWTEVFYEDLLKDPVNEFRRVFEGCGLQFTLELERHCGDVLSTPYNAFSAIRPDKWRDQGNRGRIERVLPTVADLVSGMGYGR